MKPLVHVALLLLATTAFAAEKPSDFHAHLGIQLWSLRAQFKTDGAAALDRAKAQGLVDVETYSGTGLTPDQLATELKARGMHVVGAHISYDSIKKDIGAAIREAKALGAKFVFIPHMPKFKGLKADEVRALAAEFNTFGAAFKAEGIRFGLHNHGFEFTPTGNGDEVGFDVFARETKPELVCFEMDVFWAVHAGQDPVKLLQKYPDRWVALHVKDMRPGTVTGLSTGGAPPTDAVAVGTGKIDWPAVLRAAQANGITQFFIEDETTDPMRNIPASVAYLRALKL